MSSTVHQHINLPEGASATPASLAAAITTALVELEDRVVAAGRRPIWDSANFFTHEDNSPPDREYGESQLAQPSTIRTLQISVLTIDPQEVSA